MRIIGSSLFLLALVLGCSKPSSEIEIKASEHVSSDFKFGDKLTCRYMKTTSGGIGREFHAFDLLTSSPTMIHHTLNRQMRKLHEDEQSLVLVKSSSGPAFTTVFSLAKKTGLFSMSHTISGDGVIAKAGVGTCEGAE